MWNDTFTSCDQCVASLIRELCRPRGKVSLRKKRFLWQTKSKWSPSRPAISLHVGVKMGKNGPGCAEKETEKLPVHCFTFDIKSKSMPIIETAQETKWQEKAAGCRVPT